MPYIRRLILHVRRGRYQLLRLRTQLFAVPATTRLSKRTVPRYELADDNYLYGFWQIDDDSWLRDVLFGRDRWLVLRYELVAMPGNTRAASDVRVTGRLTDPTWSIEKPTITEAQRLFERLRHTDPAEPFAATELALAPVSRPTTSDQLPRACRS